MDDVIIGRRLCPFAEPARGGTRFAELRELEGEKAAADATGAAVAEASERGKGFGSGGRAARAAAEARADSVAEHLRAQVEAELKRLAAQPAEAHATTLCALPPQAEALLGFEGFMERVVEPLQALADDPDRYDIQVVPFHPSAEYGLPHPAEEYAGRAPVACVHLLRNGDVEEAQQRWAAEGLSTDTISAENAARLRAMGERAAKRAVLSVAGGADSGNMHREAVPMAASTRDGSRTPMAAAALLTEVSESGGEFAALKLRRVSADEWGAVAARDIEWDEPFIVMPRAAIRTPIDARAEGLIGAGNLAPPAALAALIVRAARRREQQSPDQKVPLAAYVGMLPPLAAVRERHPLMASDQQLEAALGGGTLVGAEAVTRAREARAMASQIAAAVAASEAADVDGVADSVCAAAHSLEEEALWALACVSSRAFALDIPEEGPATLCLCPLADMLNHSPLSAAQQRACLTWDEDRNAAIIRAASDHVPGEEVFDSFGGTLSPAEGFLRYGFAETGASDRAAVRSDRLGNAKTPLGTELISRAGLAGAQLVLGPEGPDDIGLAYVMALEADVDELENAGWPESVLTLEAVDAASEGGADEAAAEAIAALCGSEAGWAMALEARAAARLASTLNEILRSAEYSAAMDSEQLVDGRGAPPAWAPHAIAALASEARALKGAAAAASAWAKAARGGGARRRAAARVLD